MQSTIRYTLGKQERLKSRKIIDQLFKEGKFFSVFPIRIVWQHREKTATSLQAGFTVSSKHFKKAVHRNRIRRLMKEAYRLQKNNLQLQVEQSDKQLVIFLMYVGKEIPEYSLITEKIKTVLSRLQKMVHEDSTANN
ncbi:ribonuclease P protein component [Ferruginibacter sp.]|uniref:ribonuclease P protein component n=1 Tax=Ferruginibacter sp. TaxID=1940288 RepID=UPI002659CF62|nr:ribonuclease P protein component [Ferruginibacter sp.]